MSRMTRSGKSTILMLIHVDKSTCFHPYKIQDTSHTIGQTLIVIVLPWQSVQSITIAKCIKKDERKDSDCEKAEEKKNGVSLTVLLGILFELHVYSLHSAVCDTSPLILSLSPSLSPTRSRFPSTLTLSLCLSD